MIQRFTLLLPLLILLCHVLQAQQNDIIWKRGEGLGGIFAVAASEDGALVLSGGDDGVVRLWDRATGNHLHSFPGMTSITSVALSRNGRYVAAGGDSTVMIWDAVSGAVAGTMRTNNRVTSVLFSHNSQSLYTGSWDGRISYWDIESGDLLWFVRAHGSGVHSLALDPNGNLLASGAVGEDTVKVWEAASGLYVKSMQNQYSYGNYVSFSPLGTYLSAAAAFADTIRIWRTSDWEPAVSLGGQYYEDYTLGSRWAFTHDEKRFIGLSGDVIQFWRLSDGAVDTIIMMDSAMMRLASVLSLKVLPDESLLIGARVRSIQAGAPAEPRLVLHRPDTSALMRDFVPHGSPVLACAFTDDGGAIATRTAHDILRFDTAGRVIYRWQPPYGDEFGTGISHDGAYAVYSRGYSNQPGQVKVAAYEIGAGREPHTIAYNLDSTPGLAISPQGRFVVMFGQDRPLVLYDGVTNLDRTLTVDEGYDLVVFSDDLAHMAATNLEHDRVLIWPLPDGAGVRTISLDGPANVISFAAGTGRIVTGNDDGTLGIYDIATGDKLRMQMAHEGGVTAIASARRPDHIVTAGMDSTVKVWNIVSGELLHTYDDDHRVYRSLAVAPDRTTIVSGADDGSLILRRAPAALSASVVAGADATGLLLNSVMPNPARARVTVSFRLDAPAEASIRVFGADGREVALLARRRFEAGEHRVNWNTDMVPSGNYQVRLESDGRYVVSPMVVTH